MSRNDKLNQGGFGGQHSPKEMNSGTGGSVGGQHSPADPQGTQDKALNSQKSEKSESKKSERYEKEEE